MKHKLIFILLIFLIILSGCQNEQTITYQVTFDTGGGEVIESITASKSSDVTLPLTMKTGLHFVGWFDKSGMEEGPLTVLMNIQSDIHLEAKWQFFVTYYDNNQEVINEKPYELGSNSNLDPYTSETSGTNFVGWSNESGTLYQSTSTITSDIALYPTFEIEVSFETNSDETILPMDVTLGSNIELPIPTRNHYSFLGWFSDQETTHSIHSTTELNMHTTLYAKWELSDAYLANLVFEEVGNDLILAGSITELEDIIVPSRINDKLIVGIKDYAFQNQTGIKTLIFDSESNITYIGTEAFSNTGIVSLILPESLTTIKFGAFKGVSVLDQVIFSGSVQVLEKEAFASTSWYQQLKNYQFIQNNILFFYKGTESSITIPSHVSVIADYAFEGNTSVKTIRFEENSMLSTIGRFTFIGSRIEEIYVPDNVLMIEDYAFENNLYIRTLHFSEDSKLQLIGEHAFEKSGLTTAYFPNTVESVGIDAFSQTPWLGEYASDFVVIGDILVRFKGHITTVTIPNSIRVIGPKAMAFNFVKNVIISNSVESIEKQAFVGTHLDSVTFEQNSKLRYIGKEAFLNNYVKGDILLPSSIEVIDEGAFNNCINLKSITFVNEVPPQIESIILPQDIAKITIYVPLDFVTIYQNHPNFSIYTSIIVGK